MACARAYNKDILFYRKNKADKEDLTLLRKNQVIKLIMEMKGDSAALGVDFGTGIYQLFRYMKPNSNDEYALGISQAYVRYARENEYPLKNLELKYL